MKNITKGRSYTYADDLLVRYFKDIKNYKSLSTLQEKELSKKIQNGDKQALDELIKHNLKFVITVAKQYQGRGICLNDLICEGNMGLCVAAKEFKPNIGVRFITYAVWWIKNFIVNAIYVKSGNVYIPVGQSVKINRYNKAVQFLTKVLKKDPEIEDIANYMQLSEEEVRQIKLTKQHYASFDTNYGSEEEPITLENLIPSKFEADSDCAKHDRIDGLNYIINSMPDNRMADIVRTMFGIGTQELTLEELASRLNISSERVRQLKEKGIDWLIKNKREELKDFI